MLEYGKVICDPLHRIAHVLSRTEELGNLVDEVVVGDDGDEPASGREGTEVVAEGRKTAVV